MVWPIHGEDYSVNETARRLDIKASAVPLLVAYFTAEISELEQLPRSDE